MTSQHSHDMGQPVQIGRVWLSPDQLAVLRAWLAEVNTPAGDTGHIAMYLEDALQHDSRLQAIRDAVLHELALTIAGRAEEFIAPC